MLCLCRELLFRDKKKTAYEFNLQRLLLSSKLGSWFHEKKKPKLFINVGVDRKIMEAVRAGEIRRVFRSKCEIQVSYFAKLKGVLSRASTAPIGPRSAKEIDAP